jgi:ABC-type nitrate/sulfonate/bicarbonate transport system ATPase subunit
MPQRDRIARALLMQQDTLLLDEPFDGVPGFTTARFLNSLMEIKAARQSRYDDESSSG